jgi:hypothetical protein
MIGLLSKQSKTDVMFYKKAPFKSDVCKSIHSTHFIIEFLKKSCLEL